MRAENDPSLRRGFPRKEVQISQNSCRNRVKLQKNRENQDGNRIRVRRQLL